MPGGASSATFRKRIGKSRLSCWPALSCAILSPSFARPAEASASACVIRGESAPSSALRLRNNAARATSSRDLQVCWIHRAALSMRMARRRTSNLEPIIRLGMAVRRGMTAADVSDAGSSAAQLRHGAPAAAARGPASPAARSPCSRFPKAVPIWLTSSCRGRPIRKRSRCSRPMPSVAVRPASGLRPGDAPDSADARPEAGIDAAAALMLDEQHVANRADAEP